MDLDAIFDSVHGGGGEADLDAIFDSAHTSLAASTPAPSTSDTGDFSIWDAVSQFGSGIVEGNADTLDFINELNPAAIGGPRLFGLNDNPVNRIFAGRAGSTAREFLPEENEDYRYARTIGQFVGPGGTAGVAAKGLKIASKADDIARLLSKFGSRGAVGTDALAGIGAQGAEDLTGDSTIAPIVGAITAASAPRALSGPIAATTRAVKNSFGEPTKIKAGQILAERTGLEADQIPIREALLESGDELTEFRTLPEVTDNAGAAQLYKEMTKEGEGAQKLADYVGPEKGTRTKAREGILSDLSETKDISAEEFGTRFRQAGEDTFEELTDLESNIWEQFQRDIPVKTSSYKQRLLDAVEKHQPEFGTGGPRGELRTVINQFLKGTDPAFDGGPGVLSSGKLQKMRETALKVSRKNDGPTGDFQEMALAGAFASILDDAAEQGLPKNQYDIWKRARDLTSQKKEMFGRGTAGSAAIDPRARPSDMIRRVFKGDEKSIEEVDLLLESRPELIEDYKRAVINLIKTDAQGQLTTNKVKQFLERNESGINRLFGENGKKRIQTLLKDLQSEDKIDTLAFKASKGGPFTAQSLKVSEAIRGTIQRKIPLGSTLGGLVDTILESRALKTEQQINEFLLEAIFDPEVARELLKKASSENVESSLQVLARYARKSAEAGTRGATLASAMSGSGDEQTARTLQSSRERSREYSNRERARGNKTPSQSEMPDPTRLALESDLSFQNSAPVSGTSQLKSSIFDSPASDRSIFEPEARKSIFEEEGMREQDIAAIEELIDADPIDSAIYETESDRNPLAKNPNSSASGGFQLINQTAKSLGVDDPFDLEQNYRGYRKLREEHARLFGNDPAAIYGAHFMGSPLFRKYLNGAELTRSEQAIVKDFETKAFPRFKRIYERITSGVKA